MQTRHSWIGETLRLTLPLLILAAGVGGYFFLAAQHSVPVRAAEKARDPLVETIVVGAHDGGLDIEVDGLVVPHRDVTIASEIAGRIARKAEVCRAGRYVTRGTLLLEIDPRDYSLEVQRLTKELEQSEDQIEELKVETANTQALVGLAEEDLELQKNDLERVNNLASRNVLTDSNLDDAKHKELAVRNQLVLMRNQSALLETRRTRLEHAKALVAIQLEEAQLKLSRTKISAPLDGIVVNDLVEQDAYVQVGAPLVKIEDTSAIEVQCNLQMQDLYWLWHGDHGHRASSKDGDLSAAERLPNTYRVPPTPATVIYTIAGKRFAWEGMLSRYEGTGIDEQTRTVPCRVLIDHPLERHLLGDEPSSGVVGPGALRRGMYVTVKIHARPVASMLRVPERAVRPGNVVWCVKDGQLRIRRIRVADLLKDAVLVHADTSELKVGDHVVVSPVSLVHDGMPVREKSLQ